MIKKNSNQIWKSINELGESLQKGYSVTDPNTIRKQYLEQVKQYPLYLEWFDRIEKIINQQKRSIKILEYGSGPGILAGKIINNKNIQEYIVVEPEKVFRDMTDKETNGKAKILNGTAETFHKKNYFDIIILTATYHHLFDKPKAIKNIYNNLKTKGILIIAEVFIPDYKFDKKFNPENKVQFIENILKYTSAQILSMPKPQEADVIDQIKTAFMDILRIEELKVCLPIILEQLKISNFKNIKSELMHGNNKKINYTNVGYYFLTAKK